MKKNVNKADRAKVRAMAAVGISHDLIAKRIGCSVEDLRIVYGADLERAGPETRAMVGAHLFAAAKAGNIAAIIFWLKTRGGWVETIKREIRRPSEDAQWQFSRVVLPCNGRGICPKIADPEERRRHYEYILGRSLKRG
jgi:hypothetical protein